MMSETLVPSIKQLTLLLVPFRGPHHHEGCRMFYGGSDGTHQNHNHLDGIGQLVHSYLLHQGIPVNIYKCFKAGFPSDLLYSPGATFALSHRLAGCKVVNEDTETTWHLIKYAITLDLLLQTVLHIIR